ncbi:MAG: tetratricopeptide repeat protein, partial [Chitinophagaceae bacterium]|nr:tetratricopeptide repeat protein [Chitinophagaceae bacterium]
AVDHLLQAEKIFRALQENELLARNLNYLGTVYYSNKQPELAFRQFREALQLNIATKNGAGIAFTYGNIGHLYEKRLLYDSAYFFQQQALKMYSSIRDSAGMAKIYENIGSIFEDRAQYDSALYAFEKALFINQTNNDHIAQIEILNNIGDVYRKTSRFAEGLVYSYQALEIARKTGSLYQLSSACRDMARGFDLLKKHDSAYYYNELSRELVEQIYSAANNQQTLLLETVYDVEKKNNEIARLALDRKMNRVIMFASVVTVLLLIVLGLAIISRQRLKIRNSQAINAQEKHLYEKNRELMEVELRNKFLEQETLRATLELRSKELSNHTLHLIQKNQVLEELRLDLDSMLKDDKRDQRKQLRILLQKINASFHQDNYWDDFRAVFDQVHQDFFNNLKKIADNLTAGDLRLVALIKMNLPSADIATLLGISQDSLRVSRYRLRKKIGIPEGESLTAFLQSL